MWAPVLISSVRPVLELVYSAFTDSSPVSLKVVVQNVQHVSGSDGLFYTPVAINGHVTVNALLDTGSMACTINES